MSEFVMTRECWNDNDLNPVDRFTCSECGETFKVVEFRGTETISATDCYFADEFEFAPKYCPGCGAKVVAQ